MNLQFPSLRLARVHGTAQIVERSELFIRHTHRCGGDFLRPGRRCILLPPRRPRVVETGQAIMYDADLPFMRGFAEGLQELVLTVPAAIPGAVRGDCPQPAGALRFGPGAVPQAQNSRGGSGQRWRPGSRRTTPRRLSLNYSAPSLQAAAQAVTPAIWQPPKDT